MAQTTANYADLASFELGTRAAVAASRPGLFKRVARAFAASRQRKAESDIARFIQANGGTLTDNLEREISRKFGNIVGA